jgi:hypothetical protein
MLNVNLNSHSTLIKDNSHDKAHHYNCHPHIKLTHCHISQRNRQPTKTPTNPNRHSKPSHRFTHRQPAKTTYRPIKNKKAAKKAAFFLKCEFGLTDKP